MELEKKLTEYRAKRERGEKLSQVKLKVKSIMDNFTSSKKKDSVEGIQPSDERPLVPNKEDLIVMQQENNCDLDEMILAQEELLDDDTLINCFTWMDLIYYGLCIALWGILFVIFIKLQFGTVFVIVSALIFMYVNTRTGPKRNDEVSAYSVFNKDCKSIDGTLKGEQFEREIIYGAAGVIR